MSIVLANDTQGRAKIARFCHSTEERRASAITKARTARRKGLPPHPATADMEYTSDEVAFGMAQCQWRAHTGRFPTNSEILEMLCGLGYQKVGKGFKVVPLEPGDEGYVVTASLAVFSGQD